MANNSKVTIYKDGEKAEVSKGAVPFWQNKGWAVEVPEAPEVTNVDSPEGDEVVPAAVSDPSEQNSTWGAQGESTQS